MPHDSAGMSVVWHPSKGLGQVIGRIDDPRNELHDNCARLLPVLCSEVLDVNVTRALSGHSSVDHVCGRLVVATHDGGTFGQKAKISHDSAHVPGMFGSRNGDKEFRFSGTGSGDGLRLASVGDSAAAKQEGTTGSRATVAQIIGVRGIKECDGFLGVHSRKCRQLRVHGRADEVGRWKGVIQLGPTANNAPIFCSSEVFRHFLEHGKVMVMRARGELRQRNGGVANVWPTRNTSMQQFTKECAVGKTTFGYKGSMFSSVL